jgi:hypothetical protein
LQKQNPRTKQTNKQSIIPWCYQKLNTNWWKIRFLVMENDDDDQQWIFFPKIF